MGRKLDKICSRIAHTPQKFLIFHALETRVSNYEHRLPSMTTWPMITVVYELQPHDTVSRDNFCIWIFLSAHDPEIAPHLMKVNLLWKCMEWMQHNKVISNLCCSDRKFCILCVLAVGLSFPLALQISEGQYNGRTVFNFSALEVQW